MGKARKFTPGPWSWSYGIDDPYSLEGAGNETIIRARDGMVYSEYSSDPASLDISSPENAWLIAAAPDLFVALTACLAVLSGENQNKESLIAALQAGRDAIHKAKTGKDAT